MVSRKFWSQWRDFVKTINPDAYIVGEIWGSPASWLAGDAFDATMNYDFPRICQRFFIDRENKITPTEFDRLLRKLLDSLPPQAAYVMQNLFDSHDLDRLASQIKNPDRPYDGNNRLQDASGKNYDAARPLPEHYQVMKLMTAFQFAWLGAPMVYYGNEAGMFGADDPSNRKPMLWKDLEPYENPKDDFVMDDMLEFFKRCIAIRNTFPALRIGEIKTVLADDAQDLYAFERSLPNEDNSRIIAVINNSPQPKTAAIPVGDAKDGMPFYELLHTKAQYSFSRMPFGSGRWLTIQSPKESEIVYFVRDGKIFVNLNPKDAAILTIGG
jgi:glycosidase